jgi:ABC-2 type transport system permease protein
VVFFLTPLSMLGGSFFTMKMLPDWLHWLLWANPFFYFINGIRGAMIGVDEAPPGLSIGLTLLMIAVLGGLVWRLFSRGYGLREKRLAAAMPPPLSSRPSNKRPIPQ